MILGERLRALAANEALNPEVRGALNEAARALAVLAAERTWKPIESAPRDGTKCLVFVKLDDATGYLAIAHYGNGEWFDDQDKSLTSLSHWIPLPASPVDQQ